MFFDGVGVDIVDDLPVEVEVILALVVGAGDDGNEDDEEGGVLTLELVSAEGEWIEFGFEFATDVVIVEIIFAMISFVQ